jgi:probable rRNA maturation factor
MSRKMKLKVIFDNTSGEEILYKWKMLIRRAIEATLDYEQYENPCEVSVTLTNNEEIHKLNRQYRGVDRPTDVLSFPLFDYDGVSEEPPVDELMGMLGDIVLSLEQARLQAEEYGHSFQREIAFLTVHSMLHLLGYDHETGEEDELDMRRRQSEIMQAMGLAVEDKEENV